MEHSLNALGEPNVELDNTAALERLGEEPLTLKVGVEVLPEVKLETYKGLEVTRRKRPITDADVDKMIDSLRDASASLQPVEDRPSAIRRHRNNQCSRQISSMNLTKKRSKLTKSR